MCGWISIVSAITIAVLLVCLVKMMADSERERKAYQNRPVKDGDMYVFWNEESKRYNTCFLVKQSYEGYCVGIMYLFADGKKRIRDIVAAVVLHKKGFKNTDIYESREISIMDEEIKQAGFQRV